MAFIQLSRQAFFHNLDIIAQRTESVDKIALVLKDNAYGHGLIETASMAKEYGIKRAVVRSVHEAGQLIDYFSYILVLAEIPLTASEQVVYTLNTLDDIEKFPLRCRVEIKVDTGMHRSGVASEELEQAFEKAVAAGLKVEGVFTHFRSADTLSSEWFWQMKIFDGLKERSAALAKKYGMEPLRFHSKNSAALFRAAPCDDAMVRVGIAAYGCLQMDTTLFQPELKPVLSLWANKVATKRLLPSQRVGYNGTYRAPMEQTVSTYDVGYGDGLLRAASNNDYVTPDKTALLGRVSMDNTTFHSEAETLCIFNDANVYAESAGTIGYEVLVRLTSHLKRKVF